MNAAEKIYELVKTLPENQAAEVLNFVEFLKQKAQREATAQATIPKGTLTGLQGIAKPDQKRPLSDYLGLLKDSPTFQGDPVEIQRQLRNEWD